MAIATSVIAAYRYSNGALTTDSKASYTLTNVNTIANSSDGKSGYCADAGTTNTNKYLYRDDTYGMLGSTAKSYAFWWKCTTAPSSGVQQMMFRHLYGGSAVGNYANCAYRNNAGTYEIVMNSSPSIMNVAYTLTVGTWYHFVVTVPANNTGNLTCYVNGSSIGTLGNWSQNYALTTKCAMFADHAGTSNSPGELDEFYIFNEVISSGDITTLATGAGAGLYPFSAGPANLKSYNTNLTANIKSINTNLIANVKSLDTNV